MTRYIIGGILASLILLVALSIANYYTCFAYYLPHKPAIIEIFPGDITLEAHPQIIVVPTGFNQTTIKEAK